MESITAVIITKNEEQNIGRCLDSLTDLADEIVVVDSGSEDRTEEICRQYPNLRFVKHTWLGYGATKNFANSLATGPYILSLDADEALSPELRDSLREQQGALSGAYLVSRRTNYCGQWIHHSGWYPDKKFRLFPKGQAHWSGDPVHEDLILEETLPRSDLSGDILHYSYYTIGEHWARAKKYSELAAQRMASSSKKALLLKACVNPPLRFLKHYILKLGILDGYFGFIISLFASGEVFLKYFRAHQLRHRLPTSNRETAADTSTINQS